MVPLADAQFQIIARLAQFLLDTLALDGVANGPYEQVGVDSSLEQVVLGALLHGLQRERLVLLAGQHDNGQVQSAWERTRSRVPSPVLSGRERSSRTREKSARSQPLQSSGQFLGTFQIEECSFPLREHAADKFHVTRIVFHQQNLDRRSLILTIHEGSSISPACTS